MTDSKSEIEKLSKENFNLKLRLHYYEEQQQQQNSSTMSTSPSKPFSAAEDDAQLQHYRKLVEDAKTIISDLQDTLSQTQEDLLLATNEAEDFRQENAQLKRQMEQDAQASSRELSLKTDELHEMQRKVKSTEMDIVEMQRELQDAKIMENELAQVKQALRQSKASELEVLELKREVQRLKAAEDDMKRTLQHEAELRRDLQQNSRPTAAAAPSQELKQAQLEIAELKRSLQQAKSSELEVLELRRALQQAKSSEFQLAELKRLQQQAKDSQLEVIELRRALRNVPSSPSLSRNEDQQQQKVEEQLQQRVKQAESRAAALKQALSSQQAQYEQQIQRLVADHEAKLTERAKEKLDTTLIWEQAALRFTGTTDCNTLVDFIHDLQTEVREWEVAASEVTGGRIVDPHTLQKLIVQKREAPPRKPQHNLPSIQRVEMAEDMLREATERLERLEGSRRFKWEDALQRASALERENKRLQAELLRKQYT